MDKTHSGNTVVGEADSDLFLVAGDRKVHYSVRHWWFPLTLEDERGFWIDDIDPNGETAFQGADHEASFEGLEPYDFF